MKPARFEDVYELSPMQQGILFHTLYDPAADLYFEQCVVTLRGDLDAARFAQAWQRVSSRHAILRTSFHWEGLEKPVQVVHPEASVPLEFHDWRDLSLDLQRDRLEVFLQEDRRRSFPLASAPLLRVALFQTADDLHECVLSFQHILLDRWSRLHVLKEVFAAYNQGSPSEPLPPPRPYGDYIAWLQAQDRAQAEAFWRKALEGFRTPTALRLDTRRTTPGAPRFEEASLRLSLEANAHLQSFARRNRLTLNTLVQGAWAILVSRYSGEEDILFGATVSGRPTSLPDVESMVGLFINTLPVRVRINGEERVLPWLQKLQAWLLELRQYEHSSLLDIQGWSEVPRGTSLFESLVVFENIAGDMGSLAATAPLKVLSVRSVGGGTNYPLTLFALPGPQLSLRILASGGVFDAATISRMLGHLSTLLEGMAASPQRPLFRLPLVTEAERRQLLYEWNDTGAAYPKNQCVHRLFEEQLERSPDAVAAVFESHQLTYRELNERANRLANLLRRMGVGPQALVGIYLERSLDMVVALLATLKAGGAYVPLDPAYPRERLSFMIEDARLSLILTHDHLAAELPDGAKILCLDSERARSAEADRENLVGEASPEGLAYVIYTSGSTGKPKGVEISHRAVVNFLSSMRQSPGLTSEDTLLSVTSLSFDIAALEIYLPLIVGARLVVLPRAVASDGTRLMEAMASSRATVMQATPATWRMLVDARWQGSDRLRILCGGEALSRELANQLLARSACVWNLYGPTETTIWSTVHRVERSAGAIPIGRPIANTKIYILDAYRRPLPAGVAGELYIGGEGLARGYLRRPELTLEKFISSPFAQELAERLYRTGDRARYLSDGRIEFLGRLDNQVKIRGYRIEMGEIEATLGRYPGVRAAVVAAREEEGSKQLVAYLVLERNVQPSVADLRAFLKRTLPDYMVPSAFLFLDALPLTPNGKVDRRALPVPDRKRAQEEPFSPPRTPVENSLAEIWKEILKVDRVGVHDNFFELGGHSLLATRVVSRVAESLGVRLPLRQVFEEPTLERLALSIAQRLAQAELPGEMARMLAEIRELSDEEARDRLALEVQPNDEKGASIRPS